jgi:hypothetical protein
VGRNSALVGVAASRDTDPAVDPGVGNAGFRPITQDEVDLCCQWIAVARRYWYTVARLIPNSRVRVVFGSPAALRLGAGVAPCHQRATDASQEAAGPAQSHLENAFSHSDHPDSPARPQRS